MGPHGSEQPLQGLHGGSRRGQSTARQSLETLVVLLAYVRFDVDRKFRLHRLARHGYVPMRCSQRVLGLGTLVVGLHQGAAIFRSGSLEHQKVQAFLFLNGSVRTLHGLAHAVGHREAKLGVRVVRVFHGQSVNCGIVPESLQLLDAFVQAREVGLKRLLVHLGQCFAALQEGLLDGGQDVLIDTVVGPDAAFGKRWNLYKSDAQLVAQKFLLGIALGCFLVRGLVRIPVAGVALVLEGQVLFRTKAIELPRKIGAVVLGQKDAARCREIPFEEMLEHLAA